MNSGFVYYGDLITLYTTQNKGYLNADGVIDNSLRVLENKGSTPQKYRDCIFQLMPSQQYGAKKEFIEKVTALESDLRVEAEEKSYYDSLYESMTKETEMNQTRNTAMTTTDSVVRYGHTIQLLHVKTNKYVTADPKKIAIAEKDCQYCGVETDGSMTSWFTILPRYKMRGVGDEVEAGDEVVFELIKQENSFLHCSERAALHLRPFETQDSSLFEASVGTSTGWELCIYRSAQSTYSALIPKNSQPTRNVSRGTLKAGMLVRMYHTEARSYVGIKTDTTSAPNSAKTNPPLRLFAKPEEEDIATWRPPASSVWIVETADRKTGPNCVFHQAYRLRHFATGIYLYKSAASAASGGKIPVTLLASTAATAPDTNRFVTFKSTSYDDSGAIALETGCYLITSGQGKDYSMSQTNGELNHDFEWDPIFCPEDAIKFVDVRKQQVEELEVLSSLVPFITSAKSYLTPKTFKPGTYKLLLSKFRLILAFIYNQNTDHIPDTNIPVYDPQNEAGLPPVASRQQAARELGAVDICIELMNVAGEHLKSELENEFEEWIRRIIRVLFLIIESFIDENESNQNYISQWMDILLSYIDKGVNAERCITTMLTSNHSLLEGDVGHTTLKRFLSLLSEKGVNESALRFLAEVSAADGEAVEANQTLISKRLLIEYPKLLLSTELSSSATTGESKNTIKKWTSSVDRKEFWEFSGGEILGDTVRGRISVIQVTWDVKACKEYTCQELFDRTSVTLEDLGNVLNNSHKKIFTRMIASATTATGAADAGEEGGDEERSAENSAAIKKSLCRCRLANCYIQQINLFAELCKDRNYIAINELQARFTYEMCISVIARTQIHRRIRSAFVRLCTALWIDVAPQQNLIIPSYTRSWLDTTKNIETLPHDPNSNKFIMVQELIANHFNESGGAMDHLNEDENRLTLVFLEMAKHLVNFGFYNTISALENLCNPLVATLDGRNDNAVPKEDDFASLKRNGSNVSQSAKLMDSAASYTHIVKRRATLDRINLKEMEKKKKKKKKPKKSKKKGPKISPSVTKQSSIVKSSTTSATLSSFTAASSSFTKNLLGNNTTDDEDDNQETMELNNRLRYAKNDQNDIVAKAKTIICDILVTVTKYTTDVRLSHLIVEIRKELSTTARQEGVVSKGTELIAKVMATTKNLDTDNLSPETDICDVLMDLCKYDNTKLLNSVVELMLAQISQRRRLVQGASNIQLLFTIGEVQAWKRITSTVAEVLDLIERHEVWAELKTKKDRVASNLCHDKIKWILNTSLTGMKTESGQVISNRNCKKMLLNCNAVLALTRIFDCSSSLGDEKANENTRLLASKVNEALQAVCKESPPMQEALYEHMNLILTYNTDPKVTNTGFSTLNEIFRNNIQLCNQVRSEVSLEIIKAVLARKGTKNYDGKLLNPLMSLIICNNNPVRRNQRLVMDALWKEENKKELLVLYNKKTFEEFKEGEPEELRAMMAKHNNPNIFAPASGPLGYYISLLNLLSACCRGKATREEVRVKSLFEFGELVQIICAEETIWIVKFPLLTLLYDSYLDSDLNGEGVETMQAHMPKLLKECLKILQDTTVIQFLDNQGNDLTKNNQDKKAEVKTKETKETKESYQEGQKEQPTIQTDLSTETTAEIKINETKEATPTAPPTATPATTATAPATPTTPPIKSTTPTVGEKRGANKSTSSSWSTEASQKDANEMFQGTLDYIICGIAAIVGQELYTQASADRDLILAKVDRLLFSLTSCTRVIINGNTALHLSPSQKNKLKFAYKICNTGGDIGSWVDATLAANSQPSKATGAPPKNTRGKPKHRQSMISTHPIGEQVLWVVRRLEKAPNMFQITSNELDPIVNRVLLNLYQSDKKVEESKKWNVLPPIDLWNLKPAPKIKPPERVDGSIIKLIKFILGKNGVGVGSGNAGSAGNGSSRSSSGQHDANILRLVEMFSHVISVTKKGRFAMADDAGVVKFHMEESRDPQVRISNRSDEKEEEEEYQKQWNDIQKDAMKAAVEKIMAQLTRLGVCEVCTYLLGNKCITPELFSITLDACNLFLEASHIVTEENRTVQENMLSYLSADMGEPTTCNLQSQLGKSILWARTSRQSKKKQEKSQRLLKSKAPLEPTSKNSPKPGKQRPKRTPTKKIFDKDISLINDDEDSIDPGGSTEIMRMFDLLCSGQYRRAQLFMANQELHKEPVDFLIHASKYIEQMAKDFKSNPKQLMQAYGTLKSFLTGPCKENQKHMAMETEFVLLTNRILRELFKEAKKIYDARSIDRMKGAPSFSLLSNQNTGLQRKSLEWSILGKEVVETLLAMIEGRTDATVHKKILGVVQPRNLRDRLVTLKDMVESNHFDDRTKRHLTSEGVEIMNLLMTLSAHDPILYKQIMVEGSSSNITEESAASSSFSSSSSSTSATATTTTAASNPYYFFRSKMGRVEIIFNGILLPVYFLIPPICQKFSHVPLNKMWEGCLPRDESNLVKYQTESTHLFDMMKQERILGRYNLSGLFGTSKLALMEQVSFILALLINCVSIFTLSYENRHANSTTLQWTPDSMKSIGFSTPLMQDILIYMQCVSASYLLLAHIVLQLPVVFKKAVRDHIATRKKAGLSAGYSIFVPVWAIMTDFIMVYKSLYLMCAILSIYFATYGPIFNSFHLMSIAVRNPVARNIFMAVIYPINQLSVAGIVAIFLLYIFTTVQFFFFRGDFENGECDTLRTCLTYTINLGMRSGGGIGDMMNSPDLWMVTPTGSNADWQEYANWFSRSIFDFLFFLIIIIIIMNIVFGIIIDTFSDLRSQRDEKTLNQTTMCFICGIGRDQFDQDGQTDFKSHCSYEHNKWHYLFYLIHCQLLNEEEPDDINAYERFVLNKFLASDISWMPVGKALTMPGSHNNNAAEENKHGSGGGAADGGGSGGDDESLKETVDEMKNELKALAEQMDGIGKQMTLLLSTLNNRN